MLIIVHVNDMNAVGSEQRCDDICVITRKAIPNQENRNVESVPGVSM